MKKNNREDIRTSKDIIYFLLNIEWVSKNYANIKLTNDESTYLLSVLCNLYNIKFPEIFDIQVYNKKFYSPDSLVFYINDGIGLYQMIYSFYEYLSEIKKNIYIKKNHEKQNEIDYSFEITNKLKKKLKNIVEEYIENEKIAKSKPKNISYWTHDYLKNERFLIFKENSIIYLYFNHHVDFMAMMKRFFKHEINFMDFFHEKKKDVEIFKDLCESYEIINSEILETKKKIRSARRIEELTDFFNTDFSKIKKVNGIKKKFLGLGGDETSIIEEIGSTLKLKKKYVVYANILGKNYMNNMKDTDKSSYVSIDPDLGKFPYENEEFFVVSAFMVLHHIKNIEKIMEELNRVTVNNGFIILREHNIENTNEKILIDTEHRIYDMVISGKMKQCNIDNDIIFHNSDNIKKEIGYEAYYKSENEWDYLFNKYGFRKADININIKKHKHDFNKVFVKIYQKYF